MPDDPYSADRPIIGRAADKFGRWPFAKRVADTIADRHDSATLVIGLYGAWGDGKTSVMNLMAEELATRSDVVVVKFNPWYFHSQSQLLEGFFNTLATVLGKSLSTRFEEIGKLLRQYGTVVSVVSGRDGLSQLGEDMSTVTLDTLHQRLGDILREAGKRVVVLVDDIDRLERQEIQAIFKLVKLSAGFENTVYVLAFDDGVVADALGERYGSGGAAAGRSFLEKIIQVPLHLPPPDPRALRQLCFEGVEAALSLSRIELAEEQVRIFVRNFELGLEIRLVTPRQAKRYANALAFALPILKGEAHPVDHMLIEGIRVFFPGVYEGVRENADLFLGSSGWGDSSSHKQEALKQRVHGLLGNLNPDERDAILRLLQELFPRLKGILGNYHYGSDFDERWENEQRVCSRRYFDRYFRYGIAPQEISDQRFAELIDAFGAASLEDVAGSLRTVCETGAAELFIHKLRQRRNHIALDTAKKLSRALALAGDAIPRHEALFFGSPHHQAAILISLLLERIPAGNERTEVAVQIVSEANPISFAAECFRWLRPGKEEKGSVLDDAAEQVVGKLLADRIAVAAPVNSLWLEHGKDAAALMWIWKRFGSADQASQYIRQRIEAEPRETLYFLASLLGTAWNMNTGLPTAPHFEREQYNFAAELIEPEFLQTQLVTLFGVDIGVGDYDSLEEASPDQRLAHQFAFIHRRVTQAAATAAKTVDPSPPGA